MIYLNMPVGELYGWAVCGKNLLREMLNRVGVGYIEGHFQDQVRQDRDEAMVADASVPDCVNFGTVIHTLTPIMGPSCRSWGNRNIGYMFHEKDTISKEQKENLRKFDVLVAGSEWNAEVVRKHGFECNAIPQGVDQEIFRYKRPKHDKFVVFSGGKWEKRKGQKHVIEAFKKFSQGKKDTYLIASWDNVFDQNASLDIKESIRGIQNILHVGLQTHENLAGFIHETDIGVFPNEAEGGTNLVLMEYLSCGRAAIANDSTGQRDVLDDSYAYRINGNSLVDDIIDRLEHAYHNRDELVSKGKLAHKAMGEFSWGRMADRFLDL